MSSNALYGARPSVASADYLSRRDFILTVIAALILHLVALYLWYAMPHAQVVDIPVRVLNIKLGDGDEITAEEMKAMQPGAANGSDVENAISRAMNEDASDEQERSQTVIGSMENAMRSLGRDAAPKALDKAIAASGGAAALAVQESARRLSDVARQFVRENSAQSTRDGTSAGNSDAQNAEMISRYEQLISLWIQKFKLYPDDARAQGMQGDTVVRLRIDRQGNIRYYILENSTGWQQLDRAAIDMIRRANPVPAVPNDYPPGELIEFLIPVSFHLQ